MSGGHSRLLFAIALLTLVYIALRFGSAGINIRLETLGGVFPSTQLWGKVTWLWAFNGTSPLRLERWLLTFLLSVIGFYALLGSRFARRFGELLGPPSRRTHWLFLGAFVLVCMALFWMLRLKIAWGDTGRYEDYLLRGVVPGQTGPPQPKLLFMSAPLTTLTFYAFYYGYFNRFLTPENTVALVNVCAGGIYVVAALALVCRLASPLRIFAALWLLTLPATALFYGYREATAISAAFAILYLVAAWRALHTDQARLILVAALALGLAAAGHGLAFMLAPSLILLLLRDLLRRIRSRSWIKAGTPALLSILFFVGPLLILFGVADSNPNLVYGAPGGDAGFEQAFIRGDWYLAFRLYCGEAGRSLSDLCYPVFSLFHWVDLLNITARLDPAFPVIVISAMLVAFMSNRREWFWKSTARGSRALDRKQRRMPLGWDSVRRLIESPAIFWAAVSAGSLAFLIFWAPGLGFEHDWDLYALVYLIFMVVLLVGVRRRIPDIGQITQPMRAAGAILLALNFAGMVEFLLLLQPHLFGSVLLPYLQSQGLIGS